MVTGVLSVNYSNFWNNVKTFFKNDKVKKVLFIGFLILLFFLINKYSYSVPTTGGTGGGTGGTGGTGSTTPSAPSDPDEAVNIGFISELIGDSVDKFFTMIMTQLAVMIANLSAVVLALCVLFFTIDFLLKTLSHLGNITVASLILPNLPSIITFAVIVFLLLPSGQQVSATMGSGSNAQTISTTINNYQMITMGTPDMSQPSLMTGFMKMGEQFFGTGMRVPDFKKPSDVLSTILTIPFTIWNLAFTNGIGAIATVMFALLAFGSMFTVMGLVKDVLMAFITYVLIVGLSVILMPFLLFEKTAQIGGSIISNIVNKGLSLAIRLGLIGVVVNIIETITSGIDKAKADGLNMGTAFQTGFVLMIGMFIAGEGGQVADSVLSGRVASLNAGNFIGGAVGKVMGAGATAVVLAKKGYDKFKTGRENRQLRDSENNRNRENTADRNAMEQNEQNLQSATDSQNDAFRKNEVAQSNLRSAKEDYKKAVASGDKNAIKQARQNVKDAQDVADGTANELNERTSNLARVQQDTRIDNRRLEARINERNDVHDNLANATRTAQSNRERSIQETRTNFERRAGTVAKALGGNQALAKESAGSVIRNTEKVLGGVATAGVVAGGVARAGVVVGGQLAKLGGAFFAVDDPNVKAQMVNEVKNDLGDMAKHFYKDKVNAFSDTIRQKTSLIRQGGRAVAGAVTGTFSSIKNNGVVGTAKNVTNAINNTESMRNLYRDMGVQGYSHIQGFRERNDPTAFKQSEGYQRDYVTIYRDMMIADNKEEGTDFHIRNQDGTLMTVDEVKARNNIDKKLDNDIKLRRAEHIQDEVRRNAGKTPARYNKKNRN